MILDVPYVEAKGDVSSPDAAFAMVASFVTSLKVDGGSEEDSFLAPVHWRSDGYKGLERRVRAAMG